MAEDALFFLASLLFFFWPADFNRWRYVHSVQDPYYSGGVSIVTIRDIKYKLLLVQTAIVAVLAAGDS